MPTALTDVEGRVDLEHVAFSYRPDQKLIEDLNLAVEAGRTCGNRSSYRLRQDYSHQSAHEVL